MYTLNGIVVEYLWAGKGTSITIYIPAETNYASEPVNANFMHEERLLGKYWQYKMDLECLLKSLGFCGANIGVSEMDIHVLQALCVYLDMIDN
jgi:hypothetical protein